MVPDTVSKAYLDWLGLEPRFDLPVLEGTEEE